MPPKKQNNLQIKQQRRQLIMQKALELFANKGYHKTTMDQIASAANISKGLIYNYFNSKQDLLLALLEDYIKDLTFLISNKNPDSITDKDIIDLINMAFKQMDKYSKDALTFYYMLMAQKDIQQITSPLIQNFINQIISFLTPFFKNKGIENPRAYILTFLAALDGIGMYNILLNIRETNEMLNIAIQKFLNL